MSVVIAFLSPMVISGEPYRRVQCALQIPIRRIHLEEFEQGFRAELGIETTLESILRLFFVIQP